MIIIKLVAVDRFRHGAELGNRFGRFPADVFGIASNTGDTAVHGRFGNGCSYSRSYPFVSSLILRARTAMAPRKMPGNTMTLLIWLGASDRPVPTTLAPASFAEA